MNKRLRDRLAFLESAESDGVGAFLFVTEEGGVYRDLHSTRTYSGARLQALHDANENLIVINIGGGASDAPPHPAGNPRGRTQHDAARHNELVVRREAGEALTLDEKCYLANWKSEYKKDMFERRAWEKASKAQFDETIRRLDRLNAKVLAKMKR